MTERSILTADDLFLFNEGTHHALGEKLGAHPMKDGTYFAVWAPDAEFVSVVGDFNGWDRDLSPLRPRERSGIWEGFVPGVGHGTLYKFHIRGGGAGFYADKTDPFGFFFEVPPKTASIVWDLGHEWGDGEWMGTCRACRRLRRGRTPPRCPTTRPRAGGARAAPSR